MKSLILILAIGLASCGTEERKEIEECGKETPCEPKMQFPQPPVVVNIKVDNTNTNTNTHKDIEKRLEADPDMNVEFIRESTECYAKLYWKLFHFTKVRHCKKQVCTSIGTYDLDQEGKKIFKKSDEQCEILEG